MEAPARSIEPPSSAPTPLLASALGSLDAAEVRWCLLRGEADVGRAGGETDLLIANRDLSAAERALAAAGFVRLPAAGYGTHRFWVSYDERDGTWVKLDVVTRLEFGRFHELRLDGADSALERRRLDGSVWTLAPADAFWALLLHRLLDDGNLGAGHRERLRTLAASDPAGSPLAAALRDRCPAGWDVAEMVAAVSSDDPKLGSLGPALRAAWARRQGSPATRARAARTALARRAGRLPGARRHRGFRVALLAPDGAGKSTLARGIVEGFFQPARSYYMGLYPAGGRRRRGLPGIGLAGRLAGQWRGYTAGAIQASRGRLVVFDRYCTDALLPSERSASRADRFRRGILGHACPRPDLTIVLDAPADVLYARAGEHGEDALRARRQGYLTLAARLPDTVVIDASRDAGEVRRDAIAVIWRALRARLAAE